MSLTKHTAKAVADVKAKLSEEGLKLPTNVKTPLSSGYRPESDGSRKLSDEEQNCFQGVIGVLGGFASLAV